MTILIPKSPWHSVAWALGVWFALVLGGATTSAADVDYERDVKAVLRARCFACHGALKSEAGLRLDTVERMLKGGESGPVLKPKAAEASLLLKRITAADEAERMPPEGEPLTAAQKEAIRQWITSGAVGPTDERGESDPRDHWAFRSPIRPKVPTPNTPWGRNPIDAFVLAPLEAKRLAPQVPADRLTWLRRVTYDLTGLPPTLAEQEAFLADKSPAAHETVIAALLAKPQYGERWGRHHMDLVRYSDWWGLGAEIRNSQKHIWHFRDWIIESLNADVPYDEMIRQMLAADELYPNDLSKLRATGFLARQYFKFNRTTWLDETIEHTGKAFLGLTLNCAKCHDHKYDPLGQSDYYALRAFFEPYQIRTEMVPGESRYEKDGIPRAFDCNLGEPTYLHKRGDDRNPDKGKVITPQLPSFLASAEFAIEPVKLPIEAAQPGLRPHVLATHLAGARQAIAEAKEKLTQAKKTLAEAEAKAARAAPTGGTAATPSTEEKTGASAPFAAKPPTETAAVPKANTPTPNPVATTDAASAKPLVDDSFDKLDPELWRVMSGMWTVRDGKLVQSQVGAQRSAIRLTKPVPASFEATVSFTITGGTAYKSVGLSFDVAGDDHETLAYVSAGQPKLQISYKSGSKTFVYPREAALGTEVKTGTPYDMVIRVRDRLVNVSFNGLPALAYQLPVDRKEGALDLITFDAQAEFDRCVIKPLAENVLLVEAEKKPVAPVANRQATAPAKAPVAPELPSVDVATAAVALGERTLAQVELVPAWIEARAAADRAKLTEPEAEPTKRLIQEAAEQERLVNVAKAETDLAKARHDALTAVAAKKADADKAVATAEAALVKAKAVPTGGTNYTVLSGALKTLENNLESEASRMKPFPTTSTGRRTALAKWIANSKNPLTARVIVNHLWARHMGQPLVPTVFDFGRKGTPPTHPELLDWLAVELMEHDWSLKHIHRLIVSSQTYAMSSSRKRGSESEAEADPDNVLWSRRNPIRMEAELVRDSLLYLAGDLDLTLGGPTIPLNDDTARRRSLYFVHSNNDRHPFLSVFDAPTVQECYRRAESIIPQQALALENSRLAQTAAEKIAQRLQGDGPELSDEAFIGRAFRTVLAIEPSDAERAACQAALDAWRKLAPTTPPASATPRARQQLIQALLNHNDFVTIR